MRKGKNKNFYGSLDDYKISVSDVSELDTGGGTVSIVGGGVMPNVYAPNRPDTNVINGQSGETSAYPYYDFPDPYKPPAKKSVQIRITKPADRYPNPLVPGQMPQKPVDRYPEAIPGVLLPVAPGKPKRPKKPKKPKGGPGGGSQVQGVN